MTEEIIIDGVDVAGCEFAVKSKNDNRIKCHCAKGLLQIAKMQEQPESIKSGLCENNPNCYYKQLKRLEQENEELIEDNLNLSKENKELKEEIQFHNKENSNLLAERNALQIGYDEIREVRERYRLALEDIRVIADDTFKVCDDDCGNARKIKLIIDKINEVLSV